MIWAKDYVGIPFTNKGRERAGCDCYGVVRLALLEHYNKELPLLSTYKHSMDVQEINTFIKDNKPKVLKQKITKPTEGLLVLSASEGLTTHVGLLVTDKLILHTTKETGSIIVPLSRFEETHEIKGYYSVY